MLSAGEIAQKLAREAAEQEAAEAAIVEQSKISKNTTTTSPQLKPLPPQAPKKHRRHPSCQLLVLDEEPDKEEEFSVEPVDERLLWEGRGGPTTPPPSCSVFSPVGNDSQDQSPPLVTGGEAGMASSVTHLPTTGNIGGGRGGGVRRAESMSNVQNMMSPSKNPCLIRVGETRKYRINPYHHTPTTSVTSVSFDDIPSGCNMDQQQHHHHQRSASASQQHMQQQLHLARYPLGSSAPATSTSSVPNYGGDTSMNSSFRGGAGLQQGQGGPQGGVSNNGGSYSNNTATTGLYRTDTSQHARSCSSLSNTYGSLIAPYSYYQSANTSVTDYNNNNNNLTAIASEESSPPVKQEDTGTYTLNGDTCSVDPAASVASSVHATPPVYTADDVETPVLLQFKLTYGVATCKIGGVCAGCSVIVDGDRGVDIALVTHVGDSNVQTGLQLMNSWNVKLRAAVAKKIAAASGGTSSAAAAASSPLTTPQSGRASRSNTPQSATIPLKNGGNGAVGGHAKTFSMESTDSLGRQVSTVSVQSPHGAAAAHQTMSKPIFDNRIVRLATRAEVNELYIQRKEESDAVNIAIGVTNREDPQGPISKQCVLMSQMAEHYLALKMAWETDPNNATVHSKAQKKSQGSGAMIVAAEFQYDRNKLTFYLQRPSDGSFVDFKKIQRALFQLFKCRIWFLYLDEITESLSAAGVEYMRQSFSLCEANIAPLAVTTFSQLSTQTPGLSIGGALAIALLAPQVGKSRRKRGGKGHSRVDSVVSVTSTSSSCGVTSQPSATGSFGVGSPSQSKSTQQPAAAAVGAMNNSSSNNKTIATSSSASPSPSSSPNQSTTVKKSPTVTHTRTFSLFRDSPATTPLAGS